MKSVDLKDAWNWVAESYQETHKISTDHIHYGPWMPTEDDLKLLGSVKGKKILEVGCGGGQCSLAFEKRGAIVTGLDLSEKQIEFAINLAKKEGLKASFLVDDAETLRKIKSNSFDIVFSSYAFQYVKNLRKCFRNVRRVLKDNGTFVFSLDHPLWHIFTHGTLTVESSYFKKGTKTFHFENDKGKRRSYYMRRTVESTVDDIIGSGFIIERVIEPAPMEKDKAHDWSKYYDLKIVKMIPSTIIFKCKKKS